MPYIITTSEPFNAAVHVHRPAFTRTAVATLDEARDHVHLLGAGYGVMAHLDCVLDGTSRMPVGPLSDGTVIEVQPLHWDELRAAAKVPSTTSDGMTVAAFNAA